VRKIDELRDEIRLAQDELAIHEVVVELARNESLMGLVAELYDDNGKSRFAADPEGHSKSLGVKLPENVALSPVVTDSSPTGRLVARIRRGSLDMEVVWDAEAGFFLRKTLTD